MMIGAVVGRTNFYKNQGINNDRISDTILNKTPIFYKSNDFKKINSISIEEKIFIPTEGVFISMQLSSSIENDNQFELTFPINLHSENEIFFIENSKDPKWDNTKISSKRGFFIKNDLQNYKFGMLKLGVTYYSY